jgi:hypothetical protein
MIMLQRSFLVSIIFLFCISHSKAEPSFMEINLSKGVTADLPRNWTVMSSNKRITLEAWKESVLEANNLVSVKADFPSAVNCYNDEGDSIASISILFYPNLEISEAEAVSSGERFVRELDEGVKENYEKGVKASGGRMVKWIGTTKRTINGSIYFVSQGQFLPPRSDKSLGTHINKTILVRYLNASNSFTIIIAYREDQNFFLEPIVDKFIRSIRQ